MDHNLWWHLLALFASVEFAGGQLDEKAVLTPYRAEIRSECPNCERTYTDSKSANSDDEATCTPTHSHATPRAPSAGHPCPLRRLLRHGEAGPLKRSSLRSGCFLPPPPGPPASMPAAPAAPAPHPRGLGSRVEARRTRLPAEPGRAAGTAHGAAPLRPGADHARRRLPGFGRYHAEGAGEAK